MPVPFRSTAGEPAAFDVSDSVAARAPAAAGVKRVLIVQFAPAASAPPTGQLFVCENSPAFVPVTVSAVRFSGELPVFVSATARVALGVLSVTMPKSSATGASVATGAVGVAAVPVPLKPTVCGLPEAADAIVTAPTAAFALAGANVTLIVQLAAAASEAPQLCVVTNPAPVAAIELMLSAALPEFVSVIPLAALVVPTVWLPNARLVGFSETAAAGAATPLPESGTPCGLPTALDGIESVAERAFSAAGVKVTLIAQLAPGASVDPLQLLDAKSAALAPVFVIVPSTRFAVPVLLIDTVFGALGVPRVWLPKAIVVADKPAAGAAAAAPVPLKLRTLEFGVAL